jgi:hypothetical protein
VRSRVLKTTVLAAVAGAVWTRCQQDALRLRRLSLKCWLIGHDDWIRRTPDRLYLECFECGRETQGWSTGKSHQTDGAGGCTESARVLTREGHSSAALVSAPTRSVTRSGRSMNRHVGDMTVAA